MTIFESFLTTFEASIVFWGSWGSSENWLEPKTLPPLQILTKLSLSKSLIRTGVMLNTPHLFTIDSVFKWLMKSTVVEVWKRVKAIEMIDENAL